MRIIEIREQTVPISRYADPSIPGGDLTTSVVALITDELRDGEPVMGFGFSSFGRYAQGGLIRERFAPRLLAASEDQFRAEADGNLDPFLAWDCMMKGEKPGGHGERCVAVGTLDMALWDAVAKMAGKPLYRLLNERFGRGASGETAGISVYAGGGYPYPVDDLRRLAEEIRRYLDEGYTQVKIKIGAGSPGEDLRRIETALALLPGGDHLAVDAMNRYDRESAVLAAKALEPYRLRWFEDPCDPLDFETHALLARIYRAPLAAGEALFSLADARNLAGYGGLRPESDVLLFDPAHCYGLPEYLRIVEMFEADGWPRTAFQPHGGHLFSLHVAAGLGLGGSEANPHNFQPFGGFADGMEVVGGAVRLPEAPGIGFETRSTLLDLFRDVLQI